MRIPGAELTGAWAPEQRAALGRRLLTSAGFEVVPLADIAFRVAELAAAEHLGATLMVWEGDDGPNIRATALQLRIPYRTLATI